MKENEYHKQENDKLREQLRNIPGDPKTKNGSTRQQVLDLPASKQSKLSNEYTISTCTSRSKKIEKTKQLSIEDTLNIGKSSTEPKFKYEQQAVYWKERPKTLESMAHDKVFRDEDEKLTKWFL